MARIQWPDSGIVAGIGSVLGGLWGGLKLWDNAKTRRATLEARMQSLEVWRDESMKLRHDVMPTLATKDDLARAVETAAARNEGFWEEIREVRRLVEETRNILLGQR